MFPHLSHIRSEVPPGEPFHHIFLIKVGEERVEVMFAVPAYDHFNARHQVLQELRVKFLHQGGLLLLGLVNVEDVDQRLGEGLI